MYKNKNINIKPESTKYINRKTILEQKQNYNKETNFNDNILIRKNSKTPTNEISSKSLNIPNRIKTPIKSNNINPKINNFYNKVRNINDLNNISTFDKIIMLQKLLKELSSIKGRFESNINKLRDKIIKKCYEYFKDKIFIKEIFDYCAEYKPEYHKSYILIENNIQYLDTNLYQMINDFYFLIRNENIMTIQIIKLSQEYVHKELSDFFINFFYENVINSSFIQDELLLIIYLLSDDLLFDSFPSNINISKTNNNNLYKSLINEKKFIFWAFQSLTKKIDVRNFINSILGPIILKMENFRNSYSTDLKIANKFLGQRDKNIHHSFAKLKTIDKNKFYSFQKKKKRVNDLSKIQQGMYCKGNTFLKRTKKIVLGTSSMFNNENNNNEKGKLMCLNDLIDSYKLENNTNIKINNIEESKNVSNDNNKKEEKKESEINDSNSSSNVNNLNMSIKPKQEIEIDPFFETNSINLQFLEKKLIEIKKNSNLGSINYAMKDYILDLIKKTGKNMKHNIDNNMDFDEEDIDENVKDIEIYSTSLIIEELISTRKVKNNESFKQLMGKIKMNYKIITKIITRIINNIKDNLVSSPHIIKYVSKLLTILINKKYNRVPNNKLTELNIYIFKLNFFIGNILMPIIKNPEYNGIITTEIVSQITKDNLQIISDIFNKILSLELFNKYHEPYMTLFNPFIIEIMPQLFEMMENLDKNFIVPFWIQRLINEKNSANIHKNINYDYFKINKNENIQYQSICFSWQIFYIILDIISTNKNIFMEIVKTDEHKNILEKIINNQERFIEFYLNCKKLNKEEFFILTKINYREEFAKKMKSIIKGDYCSNLSSPTKNNEIIFYFKKCFSEILSYTKNIQKDDFPSFVFKKNEIIYGTKLINLLSKKLKNKNVYDSSLIKQYGKDIDFKKIIFPKILENIKFEIGCNPDDIKSQRILFSGNYLNVYLNYIPKKYCRNNFNLLLNELIRETEFNIEYIRSDALLQYYTKIKEVEKNNFLISKYSSQIGNLEKLKCIEYLYNKIKLPNQFNISTDSKGLITNIEYKVQEDNTKEKNENDMDILEYFKSQNQPISYFIEDFPDFQKYEEEYDNILDLEEKADTSKALYDYLSSMQKLIKKEKIIKKFDKEEMKEIIYEMQDYIFSLLYDKLFPSEPNKTDIFFYNKCSRLNFIKQQNVVETKNLIDEDLIDKAIEYLDDIDDELTPADKIKKFAKAIELIQNSINFSSGKGELGVDDILKPLIYTIIKSKPKNICSNYQYCELYLNSDLAKTQYGVILSQIGLVIECIKKLKYDDLINVTEEQFGKDEIEEEN